MESKNLNVKYVVLLLGATFFLVPRLNYGQIRSPKKNVSVESQNSQASTSLSQKPVVDETFYADYKSALIKMNLLFSGRARLDYNAILNMKKLDDLELTNDQLKDKILKDRETGVSVSTNIILEQRKFEDYLTDPNLGDGLNMIANKINELSSNAKSSNNLIAKDALKEMNVYYTALKALQRFCDNRPVFDTPVKKADYYYLSVKKELDAKYDKYRAGDFHRAEGSGIYIVQENGITPQTLSKSVVTDKVVIDGKNPVHIFFLTDKALVEYSAAAMGPHDWPYVHFDIAKGHNQENGANKFILDNERSTHLKDDEKDTGYKKLVFVPSNDWKEMADSYYNDWIHDGSVQGKLGNTLIPNVPEKFTLIGPDGMTKNITIEATQEGINFLKAMEQKMEEYKIDFTRLPKARVSNPSLESKIAARFKANSDGVVQEVKRVVITTAPWDIERHAITGEIIRKDFYAWVAYTDQSGKCFIQRSRPEKAHLGGGKYSAMEVYGSGGSSQIRCDNINK